MARGTAPAALVFRRANPVMVQGAILAGIAIVHALDPDPLEAIAGGSLVRVVPAEGLVEVLSG